MVITFPLLIAAAALLMGGRRKKSKPSSPEEIPEAEFTEEEMDEGDGPHPELGDSPEHGVVSSGTRKDRRGHFPWRVYYNNDGYSAQVMLDESRFSPVQDEIGVAASAAAAKTLLRNHFNELLIEKYPNEKPKSDPAPSRKAQPEIIAKMRRLEPSG